MGCGEGRGRDRLQGSVCTDLDPNQAPALLPVAGARAVAHGRSRWTRCFSSWWCSCFLSSSLVSSTVEWNRDSHSAEYSVAGVRVGAGVRARPANSPARLPPGPAARATPRLCRLLSAWAVCRSVRLCPGLACPACRVAVRPAPCAVAAGSGRAASAGRPAARALAGAAPQFLICIRVVGEPTLLAGRPGLLPPRAGRALSRPWTAAGVHGALGRLRALPRAA